MADSDDLLLATASGENVKLWSMPNLELHSIRPFSGLVNSTCWSSNNSLLATALEDNQINVVSLKGDSVVDLSTVDEQLCLSFSSNSRYLLSGGKAGVAQIWDLKHKTSRKTFRDLYGSVLCATFNFNDTTIATGSANGDVLLHNVVSGSCSGPLRMPNTQAIRDVKFSYFQKTLLGTASDDSSVNLWDTNTKQIIKEFKSEHKLPASGLCFSPANDMLMCSIGIDKKIVLYDVVGKKTVKLITTDAPLTNVDFYHNGACLAIGSSTGKLYLFDLRAGSTPIKSAVADKSAIKTVTFQRPATKSSSSKLLTRKGSNSSIGSTSSNKSREGTNDVKETVSRTSSNQDRKEPATANVIPEPSTGKQPVSLFSPLRGGEASATTTTTPAVEDIDIVPMEIMRAELLKKSSLLSTVATDKNIKHEVLKVQIELAGSIFSCTTTKPRSKTEEPRPASTRSEASITVPKEKIRPFESNIELTSKTEKNDLMNLRARLMKTTKTSRQKDDSNSPPERGIPETSRTLSNGYSVTVTGASPQQEGAVTAEQPIAAEQPTAAEQPRNGLHPFQVDFIRNMIEDAIEDTRESMHRGFVHIQAEMLRQFHLQQEELRKLMEQLSPNRDLVEENERLKEEIKRLKTNY